MGRSTWAGTPLGRYTPQAGTPQQVHPLAGTPSFRYTPWQVHPPGQVHLGGTHTPLGRYPPGRYTTQTGTPPGRYTPQEGTLPRQVSPQAVTTLRPQCMLGYGQQAGGMHPTGMHSSFQFESSLVPTSHLSEIPYFLIRNFRLPPVHATLVWFQIL